MLCVCVCFYLCVLGRMQQTLFHCNKLFACGDIGWAGCAAVNMHTFVLKPTLAPYNWLLAFSITVFLVLLLSLLLLPHFASPSFASSSFCFLLFSSNSINFSLGLPVFGPNDKNRLLPLSNSIGLWRQILHIREKPASIWHMCFWHARLIFSPSLKPPPSPLNRLLAIYVPGCAPLLHRRCNLN